MSKLGRDDFMTLGAPALLTGLLIFSAAREQESDDDQTRDDPEILAAFNPGSVLPRPRRILPS